MYTESPYASSITTMIPYPPKYYATGVFKICYRISCVNESLQTIRKKGAVPLTVVRLKTIALMPFIRLVIKYKRQREQRSPLFRIAQKLPHALSNGQYFDALAGKIRQNLI